MNYSVVLFLVFAVLKLLGYIAWSWLWVTSPLWIAALITVLLVLLQPGTWRGL